MELDAVAKVSRMLHDYFAPNALGLMYKDVARFLHKTLTTQTMDEYLVKLDLFRR